MIKDPRRMAFSRSMSIPQNYGNVPNPQVQGPVNQADIRRNQLTSSGGMSTPSNLQSLSNIFK